MQFRCMEWVEEFSEVGLEKRLDLIVIATDVDTALLRMVPELQLQIKKALLSPQDEADLVPVVTLFNTSNVISEHKADSSTWRLALSIPNLGKEDIAMAFTSLLRIAALMCSF